MSEPTIKINLTMEQIEKELTLWKNIISKIIKKYPHVIREVITTEEYNAWKELYNYFQAEVIKQLEDLWRKS